jgi:hypothetical protein
MRDRSFRDVCQAHQPTAAALIDDMTARRFSEATQKDYVRNVRTFTAFLGRSPDTATSDDLRRFQLHMAQQQVSRKRSLGRTYRGVALGR